MTSYLSVSDQFCGAGGSSTGAKRAGFEIRYGQNHWKMAVETYATNFPEADAHLTDIVSTDPRFYPKTDVLITSPECQGHSIAAGRKRKNQGQLSLFGNNAPHPADERSRATMWCVVRYAEHHRYSAIVVENVPQVRNWILFNDWLRSMHTLGYEHQYVNLNSQFAHLRPLPDRTMENGDFAPQSRDRLYIVFTKRGNKRPDLNLRPLAPCQQCGRDVEAVQYFKPGCTSFKYQWHYIYTCPNCSRPHLPHRVFPYYYPAANVIDWSLPAPAIGEREALGMKPLRPRTLSRAMKGLDTVGRQVIVFPTTRSHAENNRATPILYPMPTQTTRQEMAVLFPPYLTVFRNNQAAASISEPVSTITTSGAHHGVVIPPYLISYYNTGGATGLDEAVPTITTRDRHALVIPPLYLSQVESEVYEGPMPDLNEFGFRMFSPDECGRAMGFPSDYAVLGNNKERVKQYGNAVTPISMETILKRVKETFE